MVQGKVVKFLARFWTKVERTGGCWVWLGYRTAFGHGMLHLERRTAYAHRVSWELHNGRSVPAEMVVMHTCDRPWCVNPKHLKLGTQQDNQADCDRKGRRCKGEDSGTFKHGRYSKYVEAK